MKKFVIIFIFSTIFTLPAFASETKADGSHTTQHNPHPPHDHHDTDHLKYLRREDKKQKQKKIL